MGAFDILNHLRERGVTLTPEPDGNIRVKPRDKLTDADRAEIRAHKPERVALLQRQHPTRQPAPAPEIPPAVRLLCGLDDHEIAQMVQRVNVARRAGYSLDDAEVIADRLLMRDRTGLDMAMCLECLRLSGRRCTARPAQPFTPTAMHELIRCPAFTSSSNT
jgi:hypothetical protein